MLSALCDFLSNLGQTGGNRRRLVLPYGNVHTVGDTPPLRPVHEVIEVLQAADQNAAFPLLVIGEEECNGIGVSLGAIAIDLDHHAACQVAGGLELRDAPESGDDGFSPPVDRLATVVFPVCIRCETIREDSEVPSVEAVEIEANHVMDGGLVEHLPDGTKIVRREVLHFHVFILNKGLFEGFAIRIARRYTILCTMHPAQDRQG